ncbi:hypothetical protein EYC84_006696 [Monilinia fructicola]|uniref:Uncharacterized protein n=1 Tax=Monilinia fructicola TaxID=38448 RepID=A0A5M9K454_MONFR|nr:hypothetical protein EYC84_006696 [Monilinia fructicola]
MNGVDDVGLLYHYLRHLFIMLGSTLRIKSDLSSLCKAPAYLPFEALLPIPHRPFQNPLGISIIHSSIHKTWPIH